MWFFQKKRRELEDKAIEEKIAEINKPATEASKRAAASIKKLNVALKKEDIVFNLYYATHPKEEK